MRGEGRCPPVRTRLAPRAATRIATRNLNRLGTPRRALREKAAAAEDFGGAQDHGINPRAQDQAAHIDGAGLSALSGSRVKDRWQHGKSRDEQQGQGVRETENNSEGAESKGEGGGAGAAAAEPLPHAHACGSGRCAPPACLSEERDGLWLHPISLRPLTTPRRRFLHGTSSPQRKSANQKKCRFPLISSRRQLILARLVRT